MLQIIAVDRTIHSNLSHAKVALPISNYKRHTVPQKDLNDSVCTLSPTLSLKMTCCRHSPYNAHAESQSLVQSLVELTPL